MHWFRDFINADCWLYIIQTILVVMLFASIVAFIGLLLTGCDHPPPTPTERFIEQTEDCKDLTEKYFVSYSTAQERRIGERVFWICMGQDSTIIK